jgi:hypothetical protein
VGATIGSDARSMALAIDPDKVGMPSLDDWADSLFGPQHYEVGPGDPQLGLPEFEYDDGFEPAGGPDPLFPAYGLDAMELAEGPALLSRPQGGVDGVDQVDWADVASPAAFGQDMLVQSGEDLLSWDDVAASLAVEDVFVDEPEEGAWLAMAPSFGEDLLERESPLVADLGTAPASGEDLLAAVADEEELLLPLPEDGVDLPEAYQAETVGDLFN